MTLKHHCITLAHRFRLGHHVESALTLPDLLEQVLLALPHEHRSEAARIIAALLACQERHDWLGLADWLEGELAALLRT
ncbi:hypothetical protein ACK36I_04075 [Aeromonas veronii]|uniref:hypothetical protein n=1 Tax=Aeromonas veronii TaxID=654 RepID=UPI003A1EBDF9